MSKRYLDINKNYCNNCTHRSRYNERICEPDGFDGEEIPRDKRGDCILFTPLRECFCKISRVYKIKKDEDCNIKRTEEDIIKIYNELVEYMENIRRQYGSALLKY